MAAEKAFRRAAPKDTQWADQTADLMAFLRAERWVCQWAVQLAILWAGSRAAETAVTSVLHWVAH